MVFVEKREVKDKSKRCFFLQIIVGCLVFVLFNNWKKRIDTETGKISVRFVSGRRSGGGKESQFSFQCYF